jgi:toxin ParE1/3/4
MLKYRVTLEAQNDLIEIRRYTLHRWGALQSQKYLSEIRHTVRLLTKTPAIGKQRTELGEAVFSFPHESHLIYYTLHDDCLVVFGILHKRMVPYFHLEDRSQE